ncbi:hypothetical protein A2777_00755 [Candidatus Gottesmanbacteria bacterium RIFCSPHIGHO2_01_FULL_40_15]|uniref:TPM domain-containing protein n=1 Tax=Candidatus Gottesmanbacteria bacterium RIFCSPHIGHO2_01_FULL_40_15 TaxID=1798376 RepID=A0A1F5Z0S4_9BACT|nr:MAG: hypothetical protein A2777_00755 [Candidatus Gottesmanbacteria bacterium RIFCSPHIGHO2_01_FULL_40_15]
MRLFPKINITLLVILSYIFLQLYPVYAVNYPSPSGYVNDFAGLYSSGYKIGLEKKLTDFENQTGAEMAVVTVKSLEGESVEDYAVRLYEKWKVGKKEADNGLIILIVKDEREVRIEVGYGLESFITDRRAGDIIRSEIVPEFKSGNFETGTEKAINRIFKYISDNDIAVNEKSDSDNDLSSWPILLVFLIIYLFGTYLASFLGRTKEIWPGGAIGGILGLITGVIFSTYAVALIFGIFSTLFGLLLDFILSRNFKIRKEKGLPTNFWSSGGGFKSGGGSSFGGFGGGSSGGGGASGKW